MAFFAQPSGGVCLEALNEMPRKHNYLRPVTDPNTIGRRGVCVIVLDGYKQPYIGHADDIRKPIKRHWVPPSSLTA